MSNYFGMTNKNETLRLLVSRLPGLGHGDLTNHVPMSETVVLLMLTLHDGQGLSCIAKRANNRERTLYEFVLTEQDSPRLLASLIDPGSRGWWILLEALDQNFPDLVDPDQVTRIYRRLGLFHLRHSLGGGRTLVHGDLHRWNMVWHQNSLRLLDWEHAHYGYPVEDLALLEPEEDADHRSETQPTGQMAELALRAYHQWGPLDSLAWSEFVRQHRLIRMLKSARMARRHEQKASSLPDGEMREVVLDHASREWLRVSRLRTLCGE